MEGIYWPSFFLFAVRRNRLRICVGGAAGEEHCADGVLLGDVTGVDGWAVFLGGCRLCRCDAVDDLCGRHVGAVDFWRDADFAGTLC